MMNASCQDQIQSTWTDSDPGLVLGFHHDLEQRALLCGRNNFVFSQSTLDPYRQWGPFTLSKRANKGHSRPLPQPMNRGCFERILVRGKFRKSLFCVAESRAIQVDDPF